MKYTGWFRDEATGQFVQDASVVVHAPVDTCFRIWSQLENLPEIMHYLKRVQKTGPNTSHWEATVASQHVTWEATTTVNPPEDSIGWTSTDGLKNSGTVRFTPVTEGCRIDVHIMYDPPYGVVGDLAATGGVNDEFHRELMEDLENFKRAMESGDTSRYRWAA